ncbi:MAG: efflux transporter outer membrane subunit [Verrucomicrobia subdivision 3 bacterium]|nr:efflux transporter outer membrane subunit [Limisphaerales bacterium]
MKRIFINSLALGIGVLAGGNGCSTPSTNAPEAWAGLALPTAFGGGEANTNAPAGAGWLADFNDATLNALVREAMAKNPDLRVTAARLQTAQANLRLAGAELKPTLNATAVASRTKRSSTSGFSISTSRSYRYTPQLDLAWEWDVWGRLADTRAAARLDAGEAAANLHAARLSLAANTAKGWFSLAEAELQSQLARQTLQSYTNNLAVLEDGFQRGLTKALDVRLMRTSVRNAENAIQLRLRERDGARRSLEILLGRYPKGEVALTAALPTLAAAVPAGLPAQLLERRPDVLAAQRNYLAAHRRVSAARKDRLPQIKLTASAGTSSDELKEVLDINNNIWSLAANLTRPILDGGKIKSQIERAEAQREETRNLYVQTALQAFAEVETALAAEAFLVAQETALRAAVTEASEARTLALDDYQAGLAEIVTVLESQRRVFNAKRSLLELQNVRLQNRIDLYLALGGEFTEPKLEPNKE